MLRVKRSKVLIFVVVGIFVVVSILITISNALSTWGVGRSTISGLANGWSDLQPVRDHHRYPAQGIRLTVGVRKICEADNCSSLWEFTKKHLRREALYDHMMLGQIFLTTAGIVSVFAALVLIICGLLGIVDLILLNVGKAAVCIAFSTAIIGLASGLSIVTKLDEELREVLVDGIQIGAAAILAIVATVLSLVGLFIALFVTRQYP